MIHYNPTISGSLTVTGSIIVTEEISGTITASYVDFDSIANKPTLVSGSAQLTSSFVQNSQTSSMSVNYATTSSYAENIQISGSITNVKSITFNKTAGVSVAEGEMAWNNSDGTLDIGLNYGDVVLQVGQEQHFVVRNSTGTTISNGTAVYASGLSVGSKRIEVSPFTANGTIDEVRFLGLATHNISDGVNGVVSNFGYVRGLDTRGTSTTTISVGDETWAEGDILYAHPTAAGKLTKVAPKDKITVAMVTTRHQTTGVLFVRPSSFGHIDDLHDVQITTGSLVTGSMLEWNGDYFVNNDTFSSSVSTSFSSSVATITSLSSSVSSSVTFLSSSLTSVNTTQNSRLDSIESITGSYATTGSNTFFGTQTFSGSVYIANDLVVQGSSSIQYISASLVSIGTNIVQLNTANPSIRYAGLTIIDSGSVGGSGSFLYDSVQDEFIFVHRGNGVNITSSHFVLGPETYDSLGNETYLTNNKIPKGTGKEHLVDSNISDDGTTITLGSNTSISGMLTANGLTGSIAATNGVVSGSSQITYANISSIPGGIVSGSSQTIANLPTGTVSGSSQVIGILSSLNTYTGSNDTTNTTQNSRLTSIESVTGSYETRGRSIVSGSSQVDVMSTTNIARLATTGSNIFIGNQTITGSIFTTGTGNNLINSVTTQAFSSGYNDSVFILAPNQTGGGLSFNLGKAASSYNLGKMVFNYVGDQSTSNNISFGFYNYDNKLVIEGGGTVRPGSNGTQDLGSSSNRWSTVYTSDLSLNNGIGDWTIVEGEDDLFLYNNKKDKVYKFALTEVEPNVATPKKS